MATSTAQALILTEDKDLERCLRSVLESDGFEPITADRVGIAMERLNSATPELILADLDIAGGDPIEFIARFGKSGESGRVVVFVSEQSMEKVAGAIAIGVPQYLKKPVDVDEVRLALEQTRQHRRLVEELRSLREQTPVGAFPTVYGSSPEIQSVLKIAGQVAPTGANVTLIGESGSGKRLIGRLLHRNSARSKRRFMHFSCEGLGRDLLEAELFGTRDASGRLGMCEGGTLFIDEITQLPLDLQDKLATLLNARSGGSHRGPSPTEPTGVRIVAASSTSIEEALDQGRFSRALYDRLKGVVVAVPALRDRESDIPVLADHFIRAAARRHEKTLRGLTPEALSMLMKYSWPGNVRELEAIIENAVQAATGTVLDIDDLPVLPEYAEARGYSLIPGAPIQDIEREAILQTLDMAGGSTTRAARILNMSVRKIQYKLKEYRLEALSAVRSETVRSVATATPVPRKNTEFVAGSDHRQRRR